MEIKRYICSIICLASAFMWKSIRLKAEEFELKDFKAELPSITENATNRYWTATPTEFDHCSLQHTTEQCNVQFTPSQEQCQGKLSFHSLLYHFFPNQNFATVMNNFIMPEKYDCIRFYINTCKGQLEFQVQAREDIDLIPNRLRVSEATLILRVMYRVPSLYYSIISFEMKGFVNLDNKKLEITCSKAFDNTPITISLKIAQISLKEFARLFSVNEFTSANLPSAVEELKTTAISSVVVEGYYHIDGFFEFVLKGKPDTSTIFQQSTIYLVIQKPSDDKIRAGIVAYFASVSFQQVLSGIIGREIPYKIPILWFGKHNVLMSSSPVGIAKVKDQHFNEELRFFASRGMAVSNGLVISAEFPFQSYINSISPSLKEENIPLKFLFAARASSKRISIAFETDFSFSLQNAIRILMSASQSKDLLKAFSNVNALCKITKIDIVLASNELFAYIRMENSYNIVQQLAPISNFIIKLKWTSAGGWELIGQGKGIIANTEFQTEIKKISNGDYMFLGKSESITSMLLVENLAKDSSLLELMTTFSFLKFDIRNVFAKSQISAQSHFRLTGKPNIFGSDVSQYVEVIVYNSTRSRAGFAFGIVLKRVSFDALLVKMFGEREQRGSWLEKVDCAIMISSDNENDGSKKISFNLIELNEFTLKRGLSLMLRIYFPSSCGGDGLCNLFKASLGSKADAGILLKGELKQTLITCEWNTSVIRLSNNLELNDVIFSITGGQKISFLLLASLKILLYDITLQGSIESDVTGGLSINMAMTGYWKKPFGLENCIFADLKYRTTIASFSKVTFFEMEGSVLFGSAHLNRRLTTDVYLALNVGDEQQSYFYTKLASFDLTGFLEAYGIRYQLPLLLQQMKFPGPVIASYTSNPVVFKLQDLDLAMENKITFRGMIAVLGYLGKFVISVTTTGIVFEANLPELYFAKGLVRMSSKCNCPGLQKFDGPQLLIHISTAKVRISLGGVVKCLGLAKETNITVTDDGYQFMISGSILGVFDSDVIATAEFANPNQANFLIKSCIPTGLPNVTYEIHRQLQYIYDNTKKLLHSTKVRINEMETIFKESHKRMAVHSERTLAYKADMKEEILALEKMRSRSSLPCPNNCNDVCLGAPGWSKTALPFGRYYVGSPKWNKCIQEIPDIVCVVRCLGRSVIKNVRAFNKQKSLQKILSMYREALEKQKASKEFLQKAVYSVGAIINKLESANIEIDVGISIAKKIAGKQIRDVISLDKVCLQGSIEEAVYSKITFNVKGKIVETSVNLNVKASIDRKLWQNLATSVIEYVFTNSSSFKESLNKVQSMLRDIDKDKMKILQDMKESIAKNDMNEASKKDVVASDEEEFKRFAFMELPRYTLGNDGIIKLFNKDSPWSAIKGNDPLEDAFISNGTRRMIPEKPDSFDDDGGEATKKSSCTSFKDALRGYRDILRVATEIAENFFEEKISYLKSKNRQLAALRDIEDQIKSDCYLQNCTIGELSDALKYAGKTKSGLIQWMKEVKHQIDKHDRLSLQIVSDNIAKIVEKENDMNLSKYIRSLNENLSKAYTRSIKDDGDPKVSPLLEQMDVDVRDLLLNSRGRRLVDTAPLIFSMKSRFKKIAHDMKQDCSN